MTAPTGPEPQLIPQGPPGLRECTPLLTFCLFQLTENPALEVSLCVVPPPVLDSNTFPLKVFHKLLVWGWADNTPKSMTGREEQPNSQDRNTMAENSWMVSVFPGHDHTEVPAGEREPAHTAVGVINRQKLERTLDLYLNSDSQLGVVSNKSEIRP